MTFQLKTLTIFSRSCDLHMLYLNHRHSGGWRRGE